MPEELPKTDVLHGMRYVLWRSKLAAVDGDCRLSPSPAAVGSADLSISTQRPGRDERGKIYFTVIFRRLPFIHGVDDTAVAGWRCGFDRVFVKTVSAVSSDATGGRPLGGWWCSGPIG